MISPPEIDVAAGMEVYANDSPGCSARIKGEPEDFKVEEVIAGLDPSAEPKAGMLPLYMVTKRGIDTLHLEAELAEVLKSRLAFAGMKDKRAVAVQYVTPTSTRTQQPQTVQGSGYTAKLVGYVDRPLSKGMMTGNRFDLVLRDCCPEIEDKVREVIGLAGARRVPNFYGLQRFGGGGALSHRIGRALVCGRFDEAVRILLCEPRETDGDRAREARVAIAKGRYNDGYSLLPPGQDVERIVTRRLAEHPDDKAGAFRGLPIRLRKLYVQAFQSYLFNRTLSIALKRGLDISRAEAGDNWGEVSLDGMVLEKIHGVKEAMTPAAVPLVQMPGYAFRDYGSRFDSCLVEVLAAEGVAARDFFLKQMQEVSAEGGFRRPYMTARILEYEVGGGTARLRFTLARGEYATVLLREIVKPADPIRLGFA